jgi:FkbM family methyltransferase
VIVSYAQNLEDVVLARGLTAATGFYIDVGAASPSVHSVTKHFYDHGWRGINIDPIASWQEQLRAQRPRDVNLGVGLSDEPGELELFDVSSVSGDESTFSADVAAGLRERGIEPRTIRCPVRTLADVCAEHVDGPIDFLKVDVEGWELQVLRGGDWERFRPRVVVVESTRPGHRDDVSGPTRELLADVGYAMVMFDGLNRFYVDQEAEPQLAATLAAPANVFDGWVRAREHELETHVAELEGVVHGLRAEAAPLRERLAALAGAEQRIATLEQRLAVLEEDLAASRGRARQDVAAARRDADDARRQARAAREALDAALRP